MRQLILALLASTAWAKGPAGKPVSLEQLCKRSQVIFVGHVERESKATLTKKSADGMTTVDITVAHYKMVVKRVLKWPSDLPRTSTLEAIDESALKGHSMSKALLLAGSLDQGPAEVYKSGYPIEQVAKRTGEYIFFFSDRKQLSDPAIQAWSSTIASATEVIESESKIKAALIRAKDKK
jgi:hypothetical protein